MALGLVLFFLVLLVLVLSHEFGHFYAAKKLGVKVEEFAFGFPPRLFSKQKGETTYSFNLLPLGGYVKLEGEDGESRSSRSFGEQVAYKQAIIIVAGVFANVIIAIIANTLGAGLGNIVVIEDSKSTPSGVTDIRVNIVEISDNSPAATAGLRPADFIVAIESENRTVPTPRLEEVYQFVQTHLGEEIALSIPRFGKVEKIYVTPRVNPPENEGAIGIAMVEIGLKKESWLHAPRIGIEKTYRTIQAIFYVLWSYVNVLVGGEVPPGGGVSGPIGIAAVVSERGMLGTSYILDLVAILSLTLAVFNILPIPALDGGRLVFVIIEKFLGRKIDAKIPQMVHGIGFFVLLALVILVTYFDIIKFF